MIKTTMFKLGIQEDLAILFGYNTMTVAINDEVLNVESSRGIFVILLPSPLHIK